MSEQNTLEKMRDLFEQLTASMALEHFLRAATGAPAKTPYILTHRQKAPPEPRLNEILFLDDPQWRSRELALHCIKERESHNESPVFFLTSPLSLKGDPQ